MRPPLNPPLIRSFITSKFRPNREKLPLGRLYLGGRTIAMRKARKKISAPNDDVIMLSWMTCDFSAM